MFCYNKSTHIYSSSLIKTISHGFGTRLSGDGRSIEVVRKLLKKSAIPYKSIIIPGQVHSTHVAIIENSNTSSEIVIVPDTDALITKEKGIVLTVVTADCIPILYSDSVKGIIAISHNGWKGTLHALSEKVVQKMCKMGSRVSDIRVVLGPCIGKGCYVVNKERAKMFEAAFGIRAATSKDNNWYLDLQEANKILLRGIGLSDDQIDSSDACTHCQKNTYFSYRRDGKIVGEMVSYILRST